jgi:hypothetical protein
MLNFKNIKYMMVIVKCSNLPYKVDELLKLIKPVAFKIKLKNKIRNPLWANIVLKQKT